MRRLNILLLFLMAGISLSAQFVNNGATVTIQSGATLRVETDFINNSGTVTNNGIIEVQNNFTNAATFTSASGSTVKFIGTTNSNVTPGGATFQNVSLEKTNQNITLMGNMAVAGTLTFTNDNNKVILGTNNLTINAGGSLTSADENEYVVADNTGMLIKGITTNGTITHEIGDASNYSPLSSVVSGSAYSSATLGARVVDAVHPSKPADADSYLSRYWVVNANGITDYANTMTGTYALTGDANGTTNDIKGATYHTADWHYNGTAANTGDPSITASTTTNNVDFSGQNFYGKVNLKAYLAGALPSGTAMTTTLNTNGLIPLATPYSAAPFNAPSVTATSIPANATDWILVEVRDPSTPATLISQTSAFILNDGTIVGIDGASLKLKNAVPLGHIALKHRNHLAIRTLNPIDLVTPPTLKDFSAGTSEAYTDSGITSNANMRQIGSVYALWNGDVNQDGYIRYTNGFIPPSTSIPSDALLIFNYLGNNPSNQTLTYSNYDVNLDRYTRYTNGFIPPSTTITSDALVIFSALGNVPSNQRKVHF